MLHLKIKGNKTVFILGPTLIYRDGHNSCCSDVANLGMAAGIFSPLSYYRDVRATEHEESLVMLTLRYA